VSHVGTHIRFGARYGEPRYACLEIAVDLLLKNPGWIAVWDNT
jgi:hypothetical protein